MARLTRRRLLLAAGAAGLGALATRLALPRLLRVGAPRALEGEAADFVQRLFADVDRARMWDVHAHVFGVGQACEPCRVHPDMLSHVHPVERLRFEIFLAAAGVVEGEGMDAAYLARLLELQRLAHPAGRLVLLAYDHPVSPDGREDAGGGSYYVPSEYVLRLAREHPEFEAGVSIHPYREDAAERLDRAAAAGARLVKWIPSAMGIDPASPRCDPFYRRMAALGLPLLSHAGRELAVRTDHDQGLGNPLRLRRPLEAGVRVVVAHCASLGRDDDLDAPEGKRAELDSFDLFLRLMREPRYERLLFADLSALTQVNRCGRPLETMLRATDLHHRLLQGSDYPLPAIDPLVSTWRLQQLGYLTAEERRLCNQVYEANPLLFDAVVKRCVKVVDSGRVLRFSPTVFETDWLFA